MITAAVHGDHPAHQLPSFPREWPGESQQQPEKCFQTAGSAQPQMDCTSELPGLLQFFQYKSMQKHSDVPSKELSGSTHNSCPRMLLKLGEVLARIASEQCSNLLQVRHPCRKAAEPGRMEFSSSPCPRREGRSLDLSAGLETSNILSVLKVWLCCCVQEVKREIRDQGKGTETPAWRTREVKLMLQHL